jgi:hypothetical protein
MDHRRDVLGAIGRPVDRGEFCGVARISEGDPTKALDPLREEVDELELLVSVLVEQKMQLEECGAGDEPVVLLVSAYRIVVSARIALMIWQLSVHASAESATGRSRRAPKRWISVLVAAR